VTIQWTERARGDLAAIVAFVEVDSPHYATVVARRLLSAPERILAFPQSGRVVPEFGDPEVREVIVKPYRIVYRVVGTSAIHILTIHHAARGVIGGL
jgi:toxin ParE1/3/4